MATFPPPRPLCFNCTLSQITPQPPIHHQQTVKEPPQTTEEQRGTTQPLHLCHSLYSPGYLLFPLPVFHHYCPKGRSITNYGHPKQSKCPALLTCCSPHTSGPIGHILFQFLHQCCRRVLKLPRFLVALPMVTRHASQCSKHQIQQHHQH